MMKLHSHKEINLLEMGIDEQVYQIAASFTPIYIDMH